ncbi:hypothetical protein ILYODFUR_034231 [Ilyodon furcidens]|uniref:Uncharacterized protein n=1 Tax=Ilyodon furcidens TaxID=33524 RepID=A0ABV0TDF1_9TELE
MNKFNFFSTVTKHQLWSQYLHMKLNDYNSNMNRSPAVASQSHNSCLSSFVALARSVVAEGRLLVWSSSSIASVLFSPLLSTSSLLFCFLTDGFQIFLSLFKKTGQKQKIFS